MYLGLLWVLCDYCVWNFANKREEWLTSILRFSSELKKKQGETMSIPNKACNLIVLFLRYCQRQIIVGYDHNLILSQSYLTFIKL